MTRETVTLQITPPEGLVAANITNALLALECLATEIPPSAEEGSILAIATIFAKNKKFTDREEEIYLAVVVGDQSSAEIAEAIGLSPSTVKWHLRNIMSKAEVLNREKLLRATLVHLWASGPRSGVESPVVG